MNWKLSDKNIVLFLVFALLGQVLLLLWHMDFFATAQSQLNTAQRAGQITRIENSLKKRAMNSLLWQKSKEKDHLYFFDSVLTLSQSRAKVELKNGTALSLSENTLITISPPLQDNSNEIRIQFSKGGFNTRNPNQPAHIKDQSLILHLAADSDLDILKNGEGHYKLSLKKGNAKVFNNKKEYQLHKNEIIKIENNDYQKITMDASLQWNHNGFVRFYSHHASEKITLHWQGSAEQIKLYQLGRQVLKQNLLTSQKKWLTELPLGSYHATLINKDKVSQDLQIEIWQAPLVHLLSPLPRNRHLFGETSFQWTPHPEIKDFELVLKSKHEQRRQPASHNKTKMNLNTENNWRWEVWGQDKQGFKIPPLYDYKLYIREKPLAPPKLNPPKMILEKKNPRHSSWFETLFFAKAWANKKKQALLSWQAVEGAEIYTLEISSDKEFRQLVVNKQIQNTQYLWQDINTEENYYWRVAAGSLSGRMGVFSEAQFLDPEQYQPIASSTAMASRATPPKPQTQVIKPITKNEKNLPPAKASSHSEPKQQKAESHSFFKTVAIFFQPTYELKKYSENGNTKANLQGVTPLSFSSQWVGEFSSGNQLDLVLKYNQNEFSPEPKEQFPFQDSLKTRNLSAQFYWRPSQSSWGWGLQVMELSDTERFDLEVITVEQRLSFGPSLSFKTHFWQIDYMISLSPLVSKSAFGAYHSHRITTPVLWNSIEIGMDFEVQHLSSSSEKITLGNASLLMGCRF